jgi:hypothetical protein
MYIYIVTYIQRCIISYYIRFNRRQRAETCNVKVDRGIFFNKNNISDEAIFVEKKALLEVFNLPFNLVHINDFLQV